MRAFKHFVNFIMVWYAISVCARSFVSANIVSASTVSASVVSANVVSVGANVVSVRANLVSIREIVVSVRAKNVFQERVHCTRLAHFCAYKNIVSAHLISVSANWNAYAYDTRKRKRKKVSCWSQSVLYDFVCASIQSIFLTASLNVSP